MSAERVLALCRDCDWDPNEHARGCYTAPLATTNDRQISDGAS